MPNFSIFQKAIHFKNMEDSIQYEYTVGRRYGRQQVWNAKEEVPCSNPALQQQGLLDNNSANPACCYIQSKEQYFSPVKKYLFIEGSSSCFVQKWKHPVDIIKILQQNLLNIATEPTFWKCFMKTVLSRGYSETLYFNSSYWSNCCASFQEQCIAFFMKNIAKLF